MPPSPPQDPESENHHPTGTWTLLVLIAIAMTAAWLFHYYGVLLPRGTVH